MQPRRPAAAIVQSAALFEHGETAGRTALPHASTLSRCQHETVPDARFGQNETRLVRVDFELATQMRDVHAKI
jgi:hypothetical protein